MVQATTNIDLSQKSITDLKGIKYFSDVLSLNVDDNKLKSLDVSSNKKLVTFSCNNNYLAALKGSLPSS